MDRENELKDISNELTDKFIEYQQRLERPFPLTSENLSGGVERYRADPYFHAKVESLVCGVMQTVSKYWRPN